VSASNYLAYLCVMSKRAWDAKQHQLMFQQIQALHVTADSDLIHRSLIETKHKNLKRAVKWITEKTGQEFDEDIWKLMSGENSKEEEENVEAIEEIYLNGMEEKIPKAKEPDVTYDPAVVEECAQKQEEELFLLQSMYTDEELTIEGKTITVTLSPKATVVFHLPPDYPTESLFKGQMRLDYSNSGSHSDQWFSMVEAEYCQEECLCSAIMMAQDYFMDICDSLEAADSLTQITYSIHFLMGRSSQSVLKGRVCVKLIGSNRESDFLTLNTPTLERDKLFSTDLSTLDVGNIKAVQVRSRNCKRSMQLSWMDVEAEELNYRCTVGGSEFWISDAKVTELDIEVKR